MNTLPSQIWTISVFLSGHLRMRKCKRLQNRKTSTFLPQQGTVSQGGQRKASCSLTRCVACWHVSEGAADKENNIQTFQTSSQRRRTSRPSKPVAKLPHLFTTSLFRTTFSPPHRSGQPFLHLTVQDDLFSISPFRTRLK